MQTALGVSSPGVRLSSPRWSPISSLPYFTRFNRERHVVCEGYKWQKYRIGETRREIEDRFVAIWLEEHGRLGK